MVWWWCGGVVECGARRRSMAMASTFKELKVWQNAMDLAMKVFEASKSFPPEERYSLTDQIRKSSRSTAACIAEGWRKRRYVAAFASKLNETAGVSGAERRRIGGRANGRGPPANRRGVPAGRGRRSAVRGHVVDRPLNRPQPPVRIVASARGRTSWCGSSVTSIHTGSYVPLSVVPLERASPPGPAPNSPPTISAEK